MARTKSIEAQLAEILKEYREEIDDAINEGLTVAPDECKAELRNNSPKDTGDYSKGWKVKRDRKLKRAVVYNATHPGLTHLLENGHDIVNKKGRYGRAPAHPHIAAAADESAQVFIDTITKNL